MKQIVFTLGLIGILFPFSNVFGQNVSEINNMRSDTMDVLGYHIKMDFTAASNSQISAACKINFKSKMDGIDGISLDLLRLTVDSVQTAGTDLNYSYNDTLLRVDFSQLLNNGALDSLTVYYHGSPQTDPSGFGGFYFQGNYSYNIGVGFDASPHNYGRVWHPCFDNFVERATYDIEVKSLSGMTAFSNGVIFSDSITPNNENVRRWKMENEIPSYLACVGVAPYVQVNQTYTSSITGNQIPSVLAALPQDTVKLKSSFVHLFDAMDIYESSFGPYRWNKIGYTIVPFNGGAMEHATCIMYPKFAIDGGLQYETMMAHELSHHWWGDLVTCRTAEDMWINEGIAAYSESLFLDHLYGHESYLKNIMNTHAHVLQTAHYDDGGFFPLSGVPHNATYGTHTYDKGATMMHNLRTYMGDANFFSGLKAIQDHFAYKDIDAAEFRDALTTYTGFNADEFFKDYIFNPGFDGFEIDSFDVEPQGGQFNVTIYVQQKLFEAPNLFDDVPVQVTFVDSDWSSSSVVQLLSGEQTYFTVSLPFDPKMVYLNKDSQLLNAVTGVDVKVNSTGYKVLDYPKLRLKILTEEDSSFLRVEHYRVAPDSIKDPVLRDHIVISPDRYWKIDGILSNSFESEARLEYNSKNSSGGNLDNGLLIDHDDVVFNEDSLVLLWRPNQKEDWKEYAHYNLMTFSNKTDGYGFVNLTKVLTGEYTFGFRKSALNIMDEELSKQIKIYPNPTNDSVHIDWNQSGDDVQIKVFDDNGKLMKSSLLKGKEFTISTKGFPQGMYQVVFYKDQTIIGSQKFIKN